MNSKGNAPGCQDKNRGWDCPAEALRTQPLPQGVTDGITEGLPPGLHRGLLIPPFGGGQGGPYRYELREALEALGRF